jgi:hypothetical protein
LFFGAALAAVNKSGNHLAGLMAEKHWGMVFGLAWGTR